MDYFHIDACSSTPLYLQIAQSIQTAIDQGILRYNDPLPTEKELCQALDCSRIVAQMALDTLQQSNYVVRIKGKGTFVSNRKKWTINLESVVQIDSKAMLLDTPIQRKQIFQSTTQKYTHINTILDIPSTEEIYHVKRLFLIENHPLCLQNIYIPLSNLNPHFESIQEQESLFEWIETNTSRTLSVVKNQVGVCALDSWETLLLKTPLDASAHHFRGILQSTDQRNLGYMEMKLPHTSVRLEITNYG